MSKTPVLEMRNMPKCLASFTALKGVDLTVYAWRNPRTDGGKRRG